MLLTEAWNKACDERGRPTAQWQRDAVERQSSHLLRFISKARLHQIPDQELLTPLGKIVDFFARSTLVDEPYLAALTLKNFVCNGAELFASTLDTDTKDLHPGSGNEEAVQDGSNEDGACS